MCCYLSMVATFDSWQFKRLLLWSVFPLLFISCDWDPDFKEYSEADHLPILYSYGFLEQKMQSNFEVIHLDNHRNYREFLAEMRRISCENAKAGIEFTYQDTLYGLTGYTVCPSSGIIGCYFNRNIIKVKNDSLLNFAGDWEKLVHIEQFETEINRVMEVRKTFYHGYEKINPALIYIYVEDKYPIEMTKQILKEITLQFEKVNREKGPEYFKYHIIFEGYDMFDIPPPPPPPHPR